MQALTGRLEIHRRVCIWDTRGLGFLFITKIVLNLEGYFTTLKTSFRCSLSVDLFIQKQKCSRFFDINKQTKKYHRLYTSNRYIQNVLKVSVFNKTVLRIVKRIISLHSE